MTDQADPGDPTSPAGVLFGGDPHRRHDPLGARWVLVSAGRTKRPWLGAQEPEPADARPAFDPACYLCPGATRASGDINPAYDRTFVFTNDFAALRPDTRSGAVTDGLLHAEAEQGTCRVVCFSPRHDLSLGAMERGQIRHVIDVWAEQTSELGADHRWVQVFENRGSAMGASNPHPHGQIWAGTALPEFAEREVASQARYHASSGRSLLLDYAAQEFAGPRVVLETDAWLVVVPFWAAWPFETLLIPRTSVTRLDELDEAARDDLARVLARHIGGYDRLFGTEFPYSMGWHQGPFGEPAPGWQLHAHVYPPLLRAGVRKFMVGYELLAEAQRDLSPEEAAARLRDTVEGMPG